MAVTYNLKGTSSTYFPSWQIADGTLKAGALNASGAREPSSP